MVAGRDFGELIFHQGLAHAGILFFRLPGALLETKIEHLVDRGVLYLGRSVEAPLSAQPWHGIIQR